PPVVPNQAAAPRVPVAAILSDAFWQRRYGGDLGIVGKEVEIGGNRRARIVGVLAPGLELLFPPRGHIHAAADMWAAARRNFDTANRINVVFRVVARMKPGVTLLQAQLQVDRLASDLRAHYPIKQTAGFYMHVVPMFDDIVGDVRPAILSVMGAVAFVLLIA